MAIAERSPPVPGSTMPTISPVFWMLVPVWLIWLTCNADQTIRNAWSVTMSTACEIWLVM